VGHMKYENDKTIEEKIVCFFPQNLQIITWLHISDSYSLDLG
jgi:hypothetical protein